MCVHVFFCNTIVVAGLAKTPFHAVLIVLYQKKIFLAQDLLSLQHVIFDVKRKYMVVPRAIRAELFAVILFQGSPSFAFEKDKLSVSGEIRERYENRVGASFGNPNQTNVDQNNQSVVGSRIRLNVEYAVATDVRFFV